MTLSTHIHKRVPLSMALEYIAKGWKVWKSEARTVVLFWPQEGSPP